MPRLARAALPDGIFHVTGRGVARSSIFRDELDYAYFQMALLRVEETFAWKLHAFCLLPNHYHLIVEALRRDLTAGMQQLNGRYAQRFNKRYDRVGHLFQNRFSSYVIESEEAPRAGAGLRRCESGGSGTLRPDRRLALGVRPVRFGLVPGTVPETCPYARA